MLKDQIINIYNFACFYVLGVRIDFFYRDGKHRLKISENVFGSKEEVGMAS